MSGLKFEHDFDLSIDALCNQFDWSIDLPKRNDGIESPAMMKFGKERVKLDRSCSSRGCALEEELKITAIKS